MKLVTVYIFLTLFLTGVFQPTIIIFSGMFYSPACILSATDIPETNGETEDENSKDNSEYADELDVFFHNHSLFQYFFATKINYNLLSSTFLVSDFTDILIPPPEI